MTSKPIEHRKPNKQSIIALLPFMVFLGIFLGTGIILTLQGTEFAFYQLPASIAIIPAIFVSIYLGKVISKETIEAQITQFVKGAGHSNIITMCIIYLLAGAFASVAKATGSVDASVQLGSSYISILFIITWLVFSCRIFVYSNGISNGHHCGYCSDSFRLY